MQNTKTLHVYEVECSHFLEIVNITNIDCIGL